MIAPSFPSSFPRGKVEIQPYTPAKCCASLHQRRHLDILCGSSEELFRRGLEGMKLESMGGCRNGSASTCSTIPFEADFLEERCTSHQESGFLLASSPPPWVHRTCAEREATYHGQGDWWKWQWGLIQVCNLDYPSYRKKCQYWYIE